MPSNRHKVFVSYHHANDQYYKDRFEHLFCNVTEAVISRSVQMGDIDSNNKTETVRQIIRDHYLRNSTVTVVLIGTETWKRKHVDWEISSSIRDTQFNPRSGLLGILLPTYPGYSNNEYYQHTIPPRLYDNIERNFVKIYPWNEDPDVIKSRIHEAFLNRNKVNPDNSRDLYRNNRSGEKWQ